MTLRNKALQCAINELRYEHDRAKALAIYNKWEVFHEDTKCDCFVYWLRH